MKPGEDLDLEIARKVLHLVVLLDSSTGNLRVKDQVTGQWSDIPPYSSDTAAAHGLMLMFKRAGCAFSIRSETTGEWEVLISHSSLPQAVGSRGESLPHGIALAVLAFNKLFKLSKKSNFSLK